MSDFIGRALFARAVEHLPALRQIRAVLLLPRGAAEHFELS